jgi:hypothetical protein
MRSARCFPLAAFCVVMVFSALAPPERVRASVPAANALARVGVAQVVCHSISGPRDLPPPGRSWSFWIKHVTFRPTAGYPVAQAVCLPLALEQTARMVTNEPPRSSLLAQVWYKGSGYTINVTTTRCVSASRCRAAAQQGQGVTIANGRQVWVSPLLSPFNDVRHGVALTWSSGRILVRLATNLPIWWAERVTEHVKIVR